MKIAALYRYAVKSMDGTSLTSVPVGPAGIPGDRGWALRETGTGKSASAKKYAPLMLCRAKYLGEPVMGKSLPPAEVRLPDGTTVRTDEITSNAVLSRFLAVDVCFVQSVDGGGHYDDRPLHLLTTATLRFMRAKTNLDFDVRRFRPNVLIESDVQGRPEDIWVGTERHIGPVAVQVVKHVDRCVMTTLPQPDLPVSKGVFAAVYQDGGALGVYAQARTAGVWRVGDPVI
ncbi:MAG: MOSC N-terminal beta barrel domain-containing protein [Elusimicrobia bacterium]|nr:MOSC N-terminal beta barrel domain-containing protein [Elusimicrobiota bacterium]